MTLDHHQDLQNNVTSLRSCCCLRFLLLLGLHSFEQPVLLPEAKVTLRSMWQSRASSDPIDLQQSESVMLSVACVTTKGHVEDLGLDCNLRQHDVQT